MNKRIAVVSGKGGVGKTTVAVNLASSFHRLGENVLLVDANLSSPHVGLHFSSEPPKFSVHDALQGRISAEQAVVFHPTGLKYAAGHPSGLFEQVDAAGLGMFSRLAPIVLFDGPPGSASDVLAHADQVLVVVQPQLSSLLDAHRMIRYARSQGKIIAGVVLNTMDNHGLSVRQVEDFLGLAVVTVIPHDRGFVDSYVQEESYVNLFPNKTASKEFSYLASRLSGLPLK